MLKFSRYVEGCTDAGAGCGFAAAVTRFAALPRSNCSKSSCCYAPCRYCLLIPAATGAWLSQRSTPRYTLPLWAQNNVPYCTLHTAAATVGVIQDAEGAGNVRRFAGAWKPPSKFESAREEMREFGYPMWVAPGSVPKKASTNKRRHG